MKDEIIELALTPDKFAIMLFIQPNDAIIFLKKLPNIKSIESEIKRLLASFNTLEETYNVHSLDNLFCLVVMAANLMVYFHKIEQGGTSPETQEEYFMDKLELYYEKLQLHSDLDNNKRVHLDSFMGIAQNAVCYFTAAIKYYKKALNLEKDASSLKTYNLELSHIYLTAGDAMYKEPAPAVAKKYYNKAIERAEEALTQPPLLLNQTDLKFCIANATRGLGKLAYKAKAFETTLSLFIKAITISRGELATSDNANVPWLTIINKCSVSIRHILKNKRIIPTLEQKQAMEGNIAFLKAYLINSSGEISQEKLRKIIREAERKLFHYCIIPSVGFWPAAPTKNELPVGSVTSQPTSTQINFS